MRIVIILLSVALAASVAFNFYLYSQIKLSELQRVTSDAFASDTESNAARTSSNTAGESGNASVIRLPEGDPSFLDFEAILAEKDNADEVKSSWFEQIYSDIEDSRRQGKRHNHSPFIQAYLKAFPYDPHFLFLEILANHNRDNITERLSSLYELSSRVTDTTLQEQITGLISEMLSGSIGYLKQVNAWDVLATLLETTLVYDIGNIDVLIELANAYAEMQQYGLMESVLAYIPVGDRRAKELRERVAQLRPVEPSPIETSSQSGIPVSHIGEHYIVRATLDDEINASLMIDTGASTSVISEELFASLPGYFRPEFVGEFPINTAGGRVQAPIYRFQSLAIEDFVVNDIAIVVLPIEGVQADGLLGMNFLRAFRFQLDQQNDILYLSEY